MICRTAADFNANGVAPDIAKLRFKHFQARLIDTINRVLEERRNVCKACALRHTERQEHLESARRFSLDDTSFNQTSLNILNSSLGEIASQEMSRLVEKTAHDRFKAQRILDEEEHKHFLSARSEIKQKRIEENTERAQRER